MEEISLKNIPDESTLRKNYVTNLFHATQEKLQEKAKGITIWIFIDETTDEL